MADRSIRCHTNALVAYIVSPTEFTCRFRLDCRHFLENLVFYLIYSSEKLHPISNPIPGVIGHSGGTSQLYTFVCSSIYVILMDSFGFVAEPLGVF